MASGSDAYLSISGLSKRFGDFTALRDISLDVHEGEFVCFLGPSGCGKTTLLRAIAGLDIQSSGRIVQAGRDISLLPPPERDFGIVFQSYALFPNLTVAQNIAYGLESMRKPKAAIAARVAEMLELIGLPDQGGKYPAQLSGGQQQRVAIARALAMRPKVMLFDEVTSALDPELRGEVLNVIRKLGREHDLTMLMVTHQMGFAKEFADRVCFFYQGKICEQGVPLDLFTAPKNERTQQFLRAVLEAV